MTGKAKAILLLVIMYALGVASGIAWHHYYGFHHLRSHPVFAEHRIKRLASQLKLTPEQEQKVREILQKAHERASQVNEEVSWDLADIHRDSVQAIRSILTPEQAKEFERLHQKFHEHHHPMPGDEPEDAPEAPPQHPS